MLNNFVLFFIKIKSIPLCIIIALSSMVACYPMKCTDKCYVEELTTTDKQNNNEKKNDKTVWHRMRQNFRIQKTPEENHPQVTKLAHSYSRPNKNLRKLTAQTKPFIYYVLEEVEKNNLPSELALIPIVESGFYPQAVSNKGAVGIWQMLAGTGKRFGIHYDDNYDGRRDVIASTKAALQYLSFLHEEFNQDWMLAIAAYNAGEGTVQRAIKNNIKAGCSIDLWSLKLPKQTHDFVGKVLALAAVVAHPDVYQADLSPIENKPLVKKVAVKPNSPLQQIALLSGVTLQEFKFLNPGFHHLALVPKVIKEILLPWDKASQLEIQIAQLKVKPYSKTIKSKNRLKA